MALLDLVLSVLFLFLVIVILTSVFWLWPFLLIEKMFPEMRGKMQVCRGIMFCIVAFAFLIHSINNPIPRIFGW